MQCRDIYRDGEEILNPEIGESGPPRIVLDTNVVLDLLHFHDPDVAVIDAAIRSGRVQALTDEACLEELRRVLMYPEFACDASAQAALLADYRSWAVIAGPPHATPPRAPRCSDADDQKFIDLALRSRATFLISKDKAVLRLARRFARTPDWSGCAIVAPHAFAMPA